jgi:tetratricopeptide (TPR) repeat protein
MGRHYIAGNRFQDAIDLYTRGLDAYPESFKLRRHRGHRYINVRELDNAIVDLNEAVELMGDTSSDVMEFDGNGKPYGTYEHWIWYHVGLYHYLNENFDEAARAYEKCAATAMDNKGLVGASDWLYNAYQKGGNSSEAARVIDAIPADIDADRNHPYFHRVMVYKGIEDPADLLDIDKPGDQWTGRDITLGYGIANWYKFNGDVESAEKIYKAILQTPFWNSWAYVVTDKEQAS